LISTAFTQYEPGLNNNVTLLSHKDDYNAYSNIWGWTSPNGKEYVLLGHNQGTSVIDITNPQQPTEIDMIPGPTASGTIWREIKTYSHYAYVVSEHTQPNSFSGLQIMDLQYLPDSAHLVQNYRWPGVTAANARAHTVSIDTTTPYLYIQGGTSTAGTIGEQGGIRILYLGNPENPTSVATMAQRYAHDTYIRNGILFASNIYQGGHVDIWNVADPAHPRFLRAITYPNGFSHNASVSADNKYLYTTDEVTGATMKSWNIEVLYDADTTNDEFTFLTSEYIGDVTQIAHNIHVNGMFAYLSHYTEGVKVLDISNPAEPIEVGYYDTYPQAGNEFVGAWGVYPHFPSGNFVVSDIQTGLYVFQFDTVTWGGILGTVLDETTGDTLFDAIVHFVEAKKTTNSVAGKFLLKTNAGVHTLIVSQLGYFPDTVEVQIPEQSFVHKTIALRSENAFISVNRDSIGVLLNVDSTATEFLDITNTGTGKLYFLIDDVNGLPSSRQRKNNFPAKFETTNIGNQVKETLQRSFLFPQQHLSPQIAHTAFLDELASDSLGDVFGLSLHPDIRAIYGEQHENSISMKMKFYYPVDAESLTLAFAFDTDQNPETGDIGIGIYQGDIGAEYDVFVIIPPIPNYGIPPNSVIVFNNISGGNPAFFPGAAHLESDSSVSFSLNLSVLGNDDGNMNIVGSAYYWADSLGTGNPPSSFDIIPNAGHTSLGFDPFGDVPWLSHDIVLDSIDGPGFKRVTLTFDATGLEDDETYRGILMVLSNDATNPEIHLPLVLTTNDIVSVNDEKHISDKFALEQNYPNPFNPKTTIHYTLSTAALVTLKVYNVLGREIATLCNNENKEAGKFEAEFDASGLPSGIYFYRLTVTQLGKLRYTETKKFVLLK
jgi:choice-of-anchor B domain-containing protein